eukprot:gnl/MRDRNA2_/MRDRNA2_119711_c0_seq1.p1 gnl/MRDRNA2_/MRDRNA2_119711_c0~~gnl/MRDRNA2_/MRDRNA2_119711_c0_seq1.p1  ORF type:complete len:363 (-),score=75.56 gnl/MRDRNA2_/MRDRNA2_119711_c0_seq1:7-1095(-)
MVETEEQRLENDALARTRMAEHMKAVEEAEARGETGDRGSWKWAIRKRIWDHMEAENIAAPPRPVHHRIPNFVGADLTARQVEKLPEFQRAKVVKVNPDSPQKEVRATVLRHGKLLLVPQPRLRTGFFSKIDPTWVEPNKAGYAVTQQGVVQYGEPIELDAKIKVDLVVIGSVAVNPANGARIGKGEGFAELEYGMLRWMNAIDDSTPVVSCIHDCQLVDDIPSDSMLCHDVPVDIICTPTQTIRVNRKNQLPKPQGIYWDKLSPQKLASIKILQILKRKIEAETGRLLPSGPSEVLPPTAIRTGKGKGEGKGEGKRQRSESKGKGKSNGYAQPSNAASSEDPPGDSSGRVWRARWRRKEGD